MYVSWIVRVPIFRKAFRLTQCQLVSSIYRCHHTLQSKLAFNILTIWLTFIICLLNILSCRINLLFNSRWFCLLRWSTIDRELLMHHMSTIVDPFALTFSFTFSQITTISSCRKMKIFRHQTDKVLGPFMDLNWRNKLIKHPWCWKHASRTWRNRLMVYEFFKCSSNISSSLLVSCTI